MAVFQLSQALNKTNNPSLDGIFEYGFINIDNPNFPVGYNKFDSYGYADSSSTPSSPPYDQNKILGWYKAGAGDVHCAIAFEHLGLPLDPIHFQITPQPFPEGGIYIHPAKLGGGTVGTRNPLIRIHSPFTSTFSLEGTIQRAMVGCGSNVAYTILKNQSINLLSRTVLPTSSTPTDVSLSAVSLNFGDYVDIMIDSGSEGTDSCDDTAVDFIVTFIPNQVVSPVLTNSPTCLSTSLSYSVSLQQTGTVELYKVGVGLIATQNIVANGINGGVTFSGLSLVNGGVFYTIAKNSGQIDSAQSVNTVITTCTTDLTDVLSTNHDVTLNVTPTITTITCA